MSVLTTLGAVSMVFVGCFTWHQYRSADPNLGAQTRRESLIEAWTNIVIGFTINFIANLWLIPLMTHTSLPHSANWWGGWVYTTISILRQYAIRRFFNSHIRAFIHWVAGRFA